jgi:hypothetical protein
MKEERDEKENHQCDGEYWRERGEAVHVTRDEICILEWSLEVIAEEPPSTHFITATLQRRGGESGFNDGILGILPYTEF